MSITKKVTVRSVHISKGYGDEDRYSCAVTLQAPTGEINLKLKEERVNQIVQLVADLVVEATTEAMQHMTSAAMQQTAIEHKPEEDDADET
jgi:hypothetical protein